jgi:hypothetical protein
VPLALKRSDDPSFGRDRKAIHSAVATAADMVPSFGIASLELEQLDH